MESRPAKRWRYFSQNSSAFEWAIAFILNTFAATVKRIDAASPVIQSLTLDAVGGQS